MSHLAIRYNCDCENTYNFNFKKRTTIGHLLSFSISDLTFETSSSIDPLKPDAFIQTAAIIESFEWGTHPDDPVHLKGRISPLKKDKFLELKSSTRFSEKAEITAELIIYQFDYAEKKYFKAFYSNEPILFRIQTGSEVVFSEINKDIPEPSNYTFSLSLSAYTAKPLYLSPGANMQSKIFWIGSDIA